MRLFIITLLFSLILGCNSYSSIDTVNERWELYNHQLIKSEGIYSSELPPTIYNLGEKISGYGSISQELSVVPDRSYSLYISGIYSASRIWVDDQLLGEFGILGKSVEKSRPDRRRAVLSFTPKNESITLCIEFSNMHFINSSLYKWIVWGDSREIISLFIKNQSKDYLAFGLLIICSLLFIIIYITDRKNIYNLYFALFALSYAIRSYLLKSTTLESFIPGFSWLLQYQVKKSSEIWALIFLLLFFVTLFPKEFKNTLSKLFILIASVTSLLSFLPIEVFNGLNILTVMHIEVIFIGLYMILRLLVGVRNRSMMAKSSLISIILLYSSIIYDIIANRFIVSYDYMSAQIVVVVVGVLFMQIGKKRMLTSRLLIIEEVENEELRNSFSRFVPVDILHSLGNRDLENRNPGESCVMVITVAYIDIRNFTDLSQTLTPEETFNMLNRFYEIVGSCISENEGYIESFGGDGVKVIFPNSPEGAVRAIQNISSRVEQIKGLRTGMAVHFGKVVLGIIGSDNRIQTTAISDVTRIISQMDHFNSKVGVEMLITGSVYGLVNLDNSKVLYLGNIILHDETEPQDLYQILPDGLDMGAQFLETFSRGVAYIRKRNYQMAYSALQIAEKLKPTHQLTRIYIEELEKFFKSGEVTFTLRM